MSDFFWKQLTYISGLMVIGIVFALTAFQAGVEIKDLDLWLHLRVGQYILDNGVIPVRDILSGTLQGKPWVDHEWLFQAIISSIHGAFGPEGLITMQVIVVSLTLLILVFVTYRKDRLLLAAFLLFLVLQVYQTRFTIRPDIFSLLFLALEIYILAMCIERRMAIVILGLMQIFWVNMHGFFFMGPLLVILGIAAEWIKRRVPLPYEWNTIGRLSDNEYKRLKIILGVLLLACLCNPAGIQGAIYPISVLFESTGDSKIFFKHIYELQRPFTAGQWANLDQYGPYKILILISGLSFLMNRRKVDISVVFVWLFFLLFSLVAIRNMVFFSFIAYLTIMVNSMHIVLEDVLPIRFITTRFKDLTIILAHVVMAMWLGTYFKQISLEAYYDFDKYEFKSEYGGVSKRPFPYKAADFLVEHNIKGNFFNDFNSGAYLIGRVFPKIKVFIDGRTEVYGGKFFETYQKVWIKGDKKTFLALAQKHNITGAFLNSANQEVPPPCIKLFYGLKDWHLVYFDYDAMIFLKDTPQNQPIIKRYKVDLRKWEVPPTDLQQLSAVRVYPYRNISRARTLSVLKIDGPAMKELNEAAKIAPEAMDIHQLKGDIYVRARQYEKAFEHFRVAQSLFNNDSNRMRLAWIYARLKNYSMALKYYEAHLRIHPDNKRVAEEIKKLKAKLKEDSKENSKEKLKKV